MDLLTESENRVLIPPSYMTTQSSELREYFHVTATERCPRPGHHVSLEGQAFLVTPRMEKPVNSVQERAQGLGEGEPSEPRLARSTCVLQWAPKWVSRGHRK